MFLSRPERNEWKCVLHSGRDSDHLRHRFDRPLLQTEGDASFHILTSYLSPYLLSFYTRLLD